MHILLIEPDYKNKYPPLGLMKLSRYHKDRGDYVYFYKGKMNNSRIWDRIYITTLFTFDFLKVTDTINHYKSQVDSLDNIYVGGIMASILCEELKKETGIKNIITGRLTDSSIIGFDDNINIDELPLDYDILNDIQYQYPAGDNFFAYTTRGCVNKCDFCAVPNLEGKLKVTNNIKNQISKLRESYGDKRNLLLLDNNILGLNEDELNKIVNDLNDLGFSKTANYVKPLQIDTLVNSYYGHIEDGRSAIRIMTELSSYFRNLQQKNISKKNRSIIEDMTLKIGTVYEDEIDCILDNYLKLREIEKVYAFKKPLQRYIDFNQGMDARQLTENKMRILSKLPIRPFRIAYDSVDYTQIYTQALRLAHDYGVQEFSNYILYNVSVK